MSKLSGITSRQNQTSLSGLSNSGTRSIQTAREAAIKNCDTGKSGLWIVFNRYWHKARVVTTKNCEPEYWHGAKVVFYSELWSYSGLWIVIVGKNKKSATREVAERNCDVMGELWVLIMGKQTIANELWMLIRLWRRVINVVSLKHSGAQICLWERICVITSKIGKVIKVVLLQKYLSQSFLSTMCVLRCLISLVSKIATVHNVYEVTSRSFVLFHHIQSHLKHSDSTVILTVIVWLVE